MSAELDGAALYEASPLKHRRSTRAEMSDLETALHNIVRAMKPMTVRQVFYQATVKGHVEKSEAGYDRVQRMLVGMRRKGIMPYGWIADNTRWQRKPTTFRDPADAIRDTAQFYRKSLWADANQHVEIWLEKDALAGVIMPITSLYDVPLMVARGYASLSFLAEAAACITDMAATGIDTFIYHFGDFDPSGVNAADKIRETLSELAPEAQINFDRVAVTTEQIRDLNLPSRATKTTDSRAKNFGEISVELDAIDPDTLRSMVEALLNEHLPAHHLRALQAAEESERSLLRVWAEQFAGAQP
jgi:hypothetical protein